MRRLMVLATLVMAAAGPMHADADHEVIVVTPCTGVAFEDGSGGVVTAAATVEPAVVQPGTVPPPPLPLDVTVTCTFHDPSGEVLASYSQTTPAAATGVLVAVPHIRDTSPYWDVCATVSWHYPLGGHPDRTYPVRYCTVWS